MSTVNLEPPSSRPHGDSIVNPLSLDLGAIRAGSLTCSNFAFTLYT